MESDEWKDDFIEKYVKIGFERGLAEARAENYKKGAAEAKAQDVLKVMDTRGLKPTKDQRARVTAAGLDTLNLWLDRAITAATADEVFADETT